MVEEKMCYDIVKYDLMVRLNPDIADQIESKMGCRPMDFTGKRMKGYYYINPKGVDLQVDLEYLVQLALEFNPLAKASKKKTKIKKIKFQQRAYHNSYYPTFFNQRVARIY